MKHFVEELWLVTCCIHIYQLFVSRRKIFSKGKKFNIFWSCPISNKKFIILVHWSMNLHDHDNNITNIMLNSMSFRLCNRMVMHRHELNKENKNFHNFNMDELTLIKWGISHALIVDLTSQLKLLTFMHFLTWILSKWWGASASKITKINVLNILWSTKSTWKHLYVDFLWSQLPYLFITLLLKLAHCILIATSSILAKYNPLSFVRLDLGPIYVKIHLT